MAELLTMADVRANSIALDYLVMKIGNYDANLIETFMEDIKKAKELEAKALVDAYEMGMYEQDRASNLVDTEEYIPEWF